MEGRFKKDLDSYFEHDKQYSSLNSLSWHKGRYKEYDELNYFENLGFKKIIEDHPEVRKIHIDIGSGAGWLLLKTATYFDNVIGIEPSKSAVRMAAIFAKDFKNIHFINSDMIDGIKLISLVDQVFFTTSAVLSHIKDYHVVEFLKLIDNAPVGSVLFFREPYDKNIQRNLWHIRRKKWWANNLSNWDLTFCNYTNDGYSNGISGICVGKERVINHYDTTILEDIFWIVSSIYYQSKYLTGTLLKLVYHKLCGSKLGK